MDVVDVLKFKSVIDDLLLKFRVPKPQQDDLTQECYLVLLEQDWTPKNDNGAYARIVCRNRLIDLFRKQGAGIKADSLDDPRNFAKAAKISQPEGSTVTEHQLNEAVCDLPYEDYQVIHEIYFEGHTEEQAADELGITLPAVKYRKRRSIKQLKTHFEVE